MCGHMRKGYYWVTVIKDEMKHAGRLLATIIVEREPRELTPSLSEAECTNKTFLSKWMEVIFRREELTNLDRGNQEAKTLIGFTTENKDPTTENFMITEEICY